MGFVSAVVDTILAFFSLVLVIAVPLIDAQTCLPSSLFPAPLVAIKKGYAEDYGDYLMAERPPFFLGLVWVEILFLWPISIVNLYGIVAKKRWVATSLLVTGASTATSMAALMGEFLGSGRATDKLLQMYAPFVAFSILAIARGLAPRSSRRSAAAASHAPSARKKRA